MPPLFLYGEKIKIAFSRGSGFYFTFFQTSVSSHAKLSVWQFKRFFPVQYTADDVNLDKPLASQRLDHDVRSKRWADDSQPQDFTRVLLISSAVSLVRSDKNNCSFLFPFSHSSDQLYQRRPTNRRENCRETAGICWRSFWNISPPLNRCTNFCWHELDKSRGRRRRTVSLKKKKVMMVVLKVSVALFFWPKKISMHFNFPFPVLLLFYVL